MERRRNAHISSQTAMRSLVVDVRMTTDQQGPSHLHVQMEWHHHCSLFAGEAIRKKGIDSTG
jgi:hypothetical protein